MGIWILVLDNPAWPFADDHATGNQHCAIALVTPRLGEPPHLNCGGLPFWIGVFGGVDSGGVERTKTRNARGGPGNECAAIEKIRCHKRGA